MSLARIIEYLLVVLVAILVAVGVIWLLFPSRPECTDCTVSRPSLRAECDKQFFGTGVRAKQLDAGAEDEFLVAYYDQGVVDTSATSGGYSTPTSYPGATSSAPVVRGPGYVMVRAQPQFGYDTSGGQSSSSYDLSSTRPETLWQDVTVTVSRYVSPLRNDSACSQTAVRYRDGKFESYCEIPNRFSDADGGQASYRIFVRNESSVPVEYCIISNCDASAPYGQGSLCVAEQPAQ
ncbi:MAG: hypothetical protein ACKVRO_05395 [Micropepsaceae bacterium]